MQRREVLAGGLVVDAELAGDVDGGAALAREFVVTADLGEYFLLPWSQRLRADGLTVVELARGDQAYASSLTGVYPLAVVPLDVPLRGLPACVVWLGSVSRMRPSRSSSFLSAAISSSTFVGR